MTDYIDVPKPHGFLLWRNKQSAIGSNKTLPVDTPLTVVSDNEAYGEVVLTAPMAVDTKEFDRLNDLHCVTPEERRLHWPNIDSFYIHRIKEWTPFTAAKAVSLEDGLKFLPELELSQQQRQVLEQAEKLPKHLVLMDDAVSLDGDKAIIHSGLDKSKIEPVLNAVLNGAKMGDGFLSLYQLALVRKPKLMLQEKKSEASVKSEFSRKDYDEGYGGPVSFSELQALEAAQEASWEVNRMANHFTVMAQRIMGRMDIEDKEAALATLANEFAIMSQAVLNQEMAEKSFDPASQTFSEWIDDYYKMLDGEYSRSDTKAVWSTAFVNSLPDSSFMYIEPGCGEKDGEGKTKPRSCRKLPIKDASGKVDLPHLRNAIARIPQADIPDADKTRLQNKAKMMLEKENKSFNLMDKVKDAWQTVKEFVSIAQEPDLAETHFAIKQIDGQPWLVTYSTNAFEDREREIFSTKSLERYVEMAEKQSDRGTFNLWHIPGSDFAEKRWQGVAGRVLVEAGPFLDNELGQAAYKFFKQYPSGHPQLSPEGWGCSPEYRYLPEERKSGVYENIWITRTSVLPRMAAANIWTKGDVKMALSQEQIKSAEEIFGPDLAKQIIGGAEDTTKTLEAAHVNHKSADEEPEAEAPTEQPQLTLDAIAEALAQRFTADLSPLADVVTELQQQVTALQGELKSYKETEAKTKEAELPKYVFSLTRASEAPSTVAEGDKLLEQKPIEATKPVDKSGASHFFPAR